MAIKSLQTLHWRKKKKGIIRFNIAFFLLLFPQHNIEIQWLYSTISLNTFLFLLSCSLLCSYIKSSERIELKNKQMEQVRMSFMLYCMSTSGEVYGFKLSCKCA